MDVDFLKFLFFLCDFVLYVFEVDEFGAFVAVGLSGGGLGFDAFLLFFGLVAFEEGDGLKIGAVFQVVEFFLDFVVFGSAFTFNFFFVSFIS